MYYMITQYLRNSVYFMGITGDPNKYITEHIDGKTGWIHPETIKKTHTEHEYKLEYEQTAGGLGRSSHTFKFTPVKEMKCIIQIEESF